MASTRGNAIYYLIGTLVGRASGLALIPLYVLILTPSQAGAWALLAILRTLVSAAAVMGLDVYLTQEYWRREAAERSGLVRGCMVVARRWNMRIGMLVLPLAVWEPARLWVLTFLGAQAMALVSVILAQLRIEERARAHCVVICLTGGGGTALAAILAWVGLGVAGLAIGFAVPPLAVATWFFWRIGSAQAPHPEMAAYIRRLLPARIAAEIAGQADRMIIACVITEQQLGYYDLAVRCAGAVGMLLSSTKNAVLPAVLRVLSQGGDAAPAWAAWRHARWMASAGCIGMLGAALIAVHLAPGHHWAPAIVFLPGTLVVPLWTHASLGNAAAIYHHRIVGLQAWQPLLTLGLVTCGATLAAVLDATAVPWGAAAGLAGAMLGVRSWLKKRRLAVAAEGEELIVLAALSGAFLAAAILVPRPVG